MYIAKCTYLCICNAFERLSDSTTSASACGSGFCVFVLTPFSCCRHTRQLSYTVLLQRHVVTYGSYNEVKSKTKVSKINR